MEPFLDRMEEMSGRFFRFFHGRIEAEEGLSPSQFFVLKVLDCAGSVTVSELAGRMGMTVPGATGLVDRMVKTELVERDRDEADRRVVWVRLSERGRAELERARRIRRDILAEAVSTLSPDEVEQLVSLYEKVSRGLMAQSERKG